MVVPTDEALCRLLGTRDAILSLVEERFAVRVSVRDGVLRIAGEDSRALSGLREFFGQLSALAHSGVTPSLAEVHHALGAVADGEAFDLVSLAKDVVFVGTKGRAIRPHTSGQKKYIDAMRQNDITFAIGPAGTGKTYLAVSQAVAHLKENKITRVVLVRPVVEAGEHLGYLPGDLMEKVEPYLRPLYDAFYDLIPPDRLTRYFDKKVIEIAPLAYMRGRTLNDSFIILDEAQNTTAEQMKMFLTRLGFGSKAVVTGDVTQVDLPTDKESGLRSVRRILAGVEGIAFVDLTNKDVVRHEIVRKIVKAYELYEGQRT